MVSIDLVDKRHDGNAITKGDVTCGVTSVVCGCLWWSVVCGLWSEWYGIWYGFTQVHGMENVYP